MIYVTANSLKQQKSKKYKKFIGECDVYNNMHVLMLLLLNETRGYKEEEIRVCLKIELTGFSQVDMLALSTNFLCG